MSSKNMRFNIKIKNIILIDLLSITLSLAFLLSFYSIVSKYCFQLESLIKSRYLFSAEVNSVSSNDSYYIFDADIEFAISENSEKSINAKAIMQGDNITYTDIINWNASPLNSNCIAISNNLASRYNLTIGDIIFSKHIVNGEIIEYKIEQVIPNVLDTQYDANSVYDGIIIMGFDATYFNNLKFSVLQYFGNDYDNEVVTKVGFLNNIKYREDETKLALSSIWPYCIVFSGFIIVSQLFLSLWMAKKIKKMFQRAIVMGYCLKETSNRFDFIIIGNAILSGLIAFIGYVTFGIICDLSLLLFLFPLLMLLFSGMIVALLITAYRKNLLR